MLTLALQVVGHTIQEQGINSACAERVFRIDVGLSKGCGNGEPEVCCDQNTIITLHHLLKSCCGNEDWYDRCTLLVLRRLRMPRLHHAVLPWCPICKVGSS